VEGNPASWARDFRQYLTEVRSEFYKVTWPSQREYVGGTIGVVIIVAFLTSVLGVIDMVLAQVMEWIVS
jgi:preprotein translocase subunit SecE